MAKLLSGSTLRRGGSGEFIDLKGAQPQLPPSPTTSTGYTLVTDALLRTFYRSSLGNLEFDQGKVYSNIPNGNITLIGTGTGNVVVLKDVYSTSTTTGALVVEGGIGVGRNIWTGEDITVNGITIGKGYEGLNNLIIRGTAEPQVDDFNNGQQSIAIGYDALLGLSSTYKNIAIGRYALSTGTDMAGNIAVGDSALKELGTKHFNYIGSITNIVVTPSVVISNITNANPVVVTANSHGLSTGSKIFISGVIGMTATVTANNVTTIINLVNGQAFYVDAVSGNTLALYTEQTISTATTLSGTNFSSYISSGTIYGPVKLTVPQHGISTGTEITVSGVVGMTELNSNEYFVDVLNSSTLALYADDSVIEPIDGTGFVSYVSGGIVIQNYLRNDNVAIGTNAGKNLINGEQNFFLGSDIGMNFTTGSYNFFLGHEVANYVYSGNANISIGGDNIVDGLDNQVNIGSVFYYNGTGYLTLNADTGVGLGTSSTGTDTGALVVLGGVGVTDNIIVGTSATIKGSLNLENSIKFIDGTTQTTAFSILGGVPTSSTSTGIKGQIVSSGLDLYVCVATNSWVKFTGTTF